MLHVALAVLAAFGVTQLAIFLTTVYLHRAVSHRAVRFAPPVAFAMRAVIWLTTGIKPREWAAVHRKHHAYTDVAGDPHSPVLLGFWPVQAGNVVLYRKALKDKGLVARYARDLAPDAWDRLLFDRAWLGLGLGITLLCVVFGWQLGLAAAALHTVVYLQLNSAINAVGHRRGRQPWPGTSYNNQWLAWLTAGEGLHNNHHAAPTSARLALGRREIDPGWWLIAALRRVGLANVRHDEARLKVAATA